MTYAEEKRLKDAAKAKRSQVYKYDPTFMDIVRPCQGNELRQGQRVVKVNGPGVGQCPRSSGQCYVGDPETGQFICMVSVNSLKKVAR